MTGGAQPPRAVRLAAAWLRSPQTGAATLQAAQHRGAARPAGKIGLMVACGGHALQSRAALLATAREVARLHRAGHAVVMTHGNGPQAGLGLLRGELGEAARAAPAQTLDVVDAETEGSLGYALQQALGNELARLAGRRDLASPGPVALVTQVLVERDDPAFRAPSKPVGAPMSRLDAEARARDKGWAVREQLGSAGWRRLVASPRPRAVVEEAAVRTLLAAGHLVVCLGGGGIPVAQSGPDGALEGVPAVVDKDPASALLADSLGLDAVLFATAVPHVFLNFGRPNQRALPALALADARALLDSEGELGAGSMEVKVRAAADFVQGAPGRRAAIIASPDNIGRALAQLALPRHQRDPEAGTIIE
jgi:carbamate kinase